MKSYTDIKQSKKLEEILPLESADMYYHNRVNIPDNFPLPIEWKHSNPLLSQEIPCWSLAALLELLPKNYLIEANKKTTRTLYHITAISGEVTHYHQDLIDAAVEMLLKLKSR